MNAQATKLDKALSTTLSIVLPVVLILSSVWLILQTATTWIQVEYRMSGFPADPFGFTLEDRIYWSRIDLEFLHNDDGIEYFDDFQLESGAPMHNERELTHMEDVKVLIGASWQVLGAGWIIALLVVGLIQRRRGWAQASEAVSKGGRATLWLMVILGLGLAVSFGVLFVGFHRLFFEGDTWLFLYSDTFIRLYPERFWRDTFVLVAAVTGLLSLITVVVPKLLLRWGSKNS